MENVFFKRQYLSKYEYSYNVTPVFVSFEPDLPNLDENDTIYLHDKSIVLNPSPNRQSHQNLYVYVFLGRHDINRLTFSFELT